MPKEIEDLEAFKAFIAEDKVSIIDCLSEPVDKINFFTALLEVLVV